MIISHVNLQRPAGEQCQTNEDHQEGVAKLASSFSAPFGCGNLGRLMGLLHDKGKEQPDFQKYIRKASGLEPDLTGIKHVEHAYVGALLAAKYYQTASMLIANPILGHHAGLKDKADFDRAMKKSIPVGVSAPDTGLPDTTKKLNNPSPKKDLHHLVRMLFSCLVDADFLDTEKFMSPEASAQRSRYSGIHELASGLDDYLQTLKNNADNSEVNRIREEVQEQCRQKAALPPGFYSLTVPTGGGKTLSSVLWALKHALAHGKQRIIIAIPYTSIITQTASTLRKIFGDENVVEHHSLIDYDSIKDSNLRSRLKLAAENWDAPVIVTTNVQLFESMMSNKPSSCRKLHNICNSVLILDEVQALPPEFLQPIIDSLSTYTRIFGCSVLFTTASQPALCGETIVKGTDRKSSLHGLTNVQELIPRNLELEKRLRRVNLRVDREQQELSSIAEALSGKPRVLCIVNTRKTACELFKMLPEDENNYHLSRLMCPAHLRKTLGNIKSELSTTNHDVRIISTQLIEAGVDIDLPCVYRQEAGLDSILQAAGRCNREGRLERGDTYVFSTGEVPRGCMTWAKDAMRELDPDEDWWSQETMTRYFRQFYRRIHTFDKANIGELLEQPFNFNFEEAARKFHLIDDKSISVIVNYEDSVSLVRKLREEGITPALMRKLGQYTVQLRENDFKELDGKGLIDEILEGIYFIPDPSQYDEKLGLMTESHWMEELLIE